MWLNIGYYDFGILDNLDQVSGGVVLWWSSNIRANK